jgi:hypothetical protein
MAEETTGVKKTNRVKINEQLGLVNKMIKPYQLAWVSPDTECELLSKNARYMDKETQNRLTSNIAEDGFLSQLPFALKDDDKYIILSGNHRVKSARAAKLPAILILFVTDISNDKKIEYQLSHNAITGKDDFSILKELYDEIGEINHKESTGLNDLDFTEFDKINLPSINESEIDLVTMSFTFTNATAKQVEDVIKALEKEKIYKEDVNLINIDFDDFIKVMTHVKTELNIKSNSVAFLKMMNICNDHINEIKKDGK